MFWGFSFLQLYFLRIVRIEDGRIRLRFRQLSIPKIGNGNKCALTAVELANKRIKIIKYK